MTEQQLREAARSLRAGDEPPAALMTLLREAVAATLNVGRLPRSLSPYGRWDGDVAEDLLHDWMAEKLLVDGALLALVDRARTPRALLSMARRSFYHWLLSARPRNEAANIYERLIALLEADERFVCVREASARQHRWWALAESAEPFAGSDRELAAAAMAAGELAIVRYASSTRLSPVFSSEELARFATATLAALGLALTPALLMAALATRIDLGASEPAALEELVERGADPAGEPQSQPEEEVAFDELGLALLAQMTARQAEVLLATERGEESGQQLAERLGCSPATISSEQRAIGALLAPYVEDDAQRVTLLKKIVDLLYEPS